MNKQTFDINKLRIASPCPVGWETMKGDARTRHCDLCQLNVYNVAELTRAEVENLIATREGRLCMRLYKRADGTILTKDCPTGVRAYRKRVARLAGAALATVLGLFSVSFGQKEGQVKVDASKIRIEKTANQDQKGSLGLIIYDPNGAVVPNATVTIYKNKQKKKNGFTAVTDDSGTYEKSSLDAGIYTLKIIGTGFKTLTVVNIKIRDGEKSQLKVVLEPGQTTEWVGTIGVEPLIDLSSSGVQTTITKDLMDKLPH